MIKVNINKQLVSADSTFNLSLDFSVSKGSFVTIYGKSGVGKTTLLRILAGLEKPETGTIQVGNNFWFESKSKTDIKPQQRKIGMVFQDFALFPNLTIFDNLKYALSKNQSNEIITELIDTMSLSNLLKRKPNTLSGGQKQRVALARALVQQPEILLLDEPLSALDNEMRAYLQDFIIKMHKQYNLTTFMVSHDVSEVFKLSDIVLKLENGKILTSGTPESLFLEHTISEKFKVIGTVLSIKKTNAGLMVNVMYGSSVIQINSNEKETKNLNSGDKVMIESQLINPRIIKI